MTTPRRAHPETALPFGAEDLVTVAKCDLGPPKRVRCFVKGCSQLLIVGQRGTGGEVCPDHGIQCFHSSSGSTYAYRDVRRNIIVSADILVRRVIGHPFKFESHRLGLERSEDALTWNVFRSFQEAGKLHLLARTITGDPSDMEPFLFVWGLCCTNDDFDPWHLLIQARQRFESNLPVERPLTEPDVALFLPGRYLVLTEAKFTSLNTFYQQGPRKNEAALTLDELRSIYWDNRLSLLNREKANGATRIYQQLWRNTVFAEWMAQQDHPRTKAYHVNLVRAGQDERSAHEFRTMVTTDHQDRFQQLSWERIHGHCVGEPKLARLQKYLEEKTAGLTRAFKLRPSTAGGMGTDDC